MKRKPLLTSFVPVAAALPALVVATACGVLAWRAATEASSSGVGRGEIQGEACDHKTGLPLAGVTIVVDGARTTTNERGQFRVVDVEAGYTTVIVGSRELRRRVEVL